MHEDYLIAVMTSGRERLTRRGESRVAGTGDVLRISPGEWHSNGSVDKGEFSCITLYLSAEAAGSLAAMTE